MIDRYTQLDKILVKGIAVPGPYIDPSFITLRDNESIFKVFTGYVGRPDLIANEVYGDPGLYWVIIAYNNVSNTMNWPPIGEIVRCPPYGRIMRESF